MTDMELSKTFLKMYDAKRSNLDYLISSPVPVRIMVKVYNIFVHYGDIKKIEDLPEENKKELVDECRETGLKFTNETLRRSARILHTLKYLKLKYL